MTEYTTQQALDEIAAMTEGAVVEFGGGGKGQTAWIWILDPETDHDTMQIVGRGGSRYAALVALLEQVRALPTNPTEALVLDDPDSDDETEAMGLVAPKERATIEQAIEAIRVAFPDLDLFEEDDDRAPGPVWQDRDGQPVLVAITPCVGECMEGRSDVCDCRCLGANHGLARLGLLPTWGEVKALQPVRFGPKECLCGCGGLTDRKFVPGHDARFHAAQNRTRRAAAAGISLEELAEQDKEAARARSRASRAARREARTAAVGASEATDA